MTAARVAITGACATSWTVYGFAEGDYLAPWVHALTAFTSPLLSIATFIAVLMTVAERDERERCRRERAVAERRERQALARALREELDREPDAWDAESLRRSLDDAGYW